MFAPSGMVASRLAAVVANGAGETLYLAVTSRTGAYGIVPVALKNPRPQKTPGLRLALGASPDDAVKAIKAASTTDQLKTGTVMLSVDKAATVAGLATVIGALAFFEVPAVALVGPKP